MPRAPSIHLQVSRVIKKAVERLEYKFDDLAYMPSKEDGDVLLRLAQADRAMRGRVMTDEEHEEAEAEAAKELDPRELSRQLRKANMKPIERNDVREDVD